MIVSSILTNCKVNMRCCIFIIMNDTGVKIGVNLGLRRKLCYLFYINEVVTAYRAENLRHIKALTYKRERKLKRITVHKLADSKGWSRSTGKLSLEAVYCSSRCIKAVVNVDFYIKCFRKRLILTLNLIRLIEPLKLYIRNPKPFLKLCGGRARLSIQHYIEVCLSHKLKLIVILAA